MTSKISNHFIKMMNYTQHLYIYKFIHLCIRLPKIDSNHSNKDDHPLYKH